MKIEDCKEGQLVLATKKSCIWFYTTMKDFLRIYPLGVARIESINRLENLVDLKCKNDSGGGFSFSPEDLILLQDINESK